MQQAEKCPVCEAEWPGDKFVGERAVLATNETQSNRAPRRSEVRAATNAHDDNGVDESSEEDEG